MAKEVCVVCGRELGMFALRRVIRDGVVCDKCLKSVGIEKLENPKEYDKNSIRALIAERRDVISRFKPTKKVDILFEIDENNRLFKIVLDVFDYKNLLSFELLEDGETITKGGLGSAVVGGVLFGGVGAVVGAVTGGKKTKGVCTSMKLKVTLKNAHTDTVYINFITSETKKKSSSYRDAQERAQKYISALQIIADANANENASTGIGVADEIMKCKELLDKGILTQEEFEAKKKQLLGL